MAHNGIAKVQHYVPQFLLRNFGNGKKDQLYVFDKQTGRSFPTNAKNVAGEGHFYDFEFQGQLLTLETTLSQLESKAKPIFHRMMKADNLSVLSVEDRALLAVFLSIQLTRTRWFREQWRSLSALLGEKLRLMAKSEEELKGIKEYITVPDQNKTAMEVSAFMLKTTNDFAAHFLNKVWVLLRTERSAPFLVGDHPLAMQNMFDMSPRGNIGLAVPGIEIYFPISPIRALALWCPSHKEMFEKALGNLRFMSQIAPHLVAAKVRDPLAIKQTLAAIETGCPLSYRTENVVNFNSLQILSAERFVLSCIDEFTLARSMIADHPTMRTGPRIQIH